MSLLQVRGIGKKWNGHSVLHEISFAQHQSEKMAMAGASGSGKTTLLKIIAGLVQADEGEVVFEGARVLGPQEKLMPGHPRIAYLSQHFELRNNYRVEEELSYTNQLSDTDASMLFRVCRIDHLLKRWTNELSGGERQRISLARQLISAPSLLLLDEPFSNLDAVHKTILKSVIHELTEQLNISCILVSHDPPDLLSWADRIMILKNGQLIQDDIPEKIYHCPVDEYTAGLFGNFTTLSKDQLNLFGVNGQMDTGDPKFIRPEQFKIVSPGNGWEGTVTSIQFFGSYNELQVTNQELKITVRTEKKYSIGDAIWIRLNH